MTSKAALVLHFTGSRENLTDEAKRDITGVIDLFWDVIYTVEYDTQEHADRAIKEGVAAIVATVDSWAWAETESSTEWVSAFLKGALVLLKPVATEFVKIGLQAGISALKGGFA